MEIGETVVKTSALTPKAILHQKYGTRASYKTEEIKESVGNGCPGLVIPQQSRILFRCCLKLPEFSVTSDTFTKKKDAEQAAAQLALEQLGIQPMKSNPTMQEIWDHLVYRLSYLFTDEFLSSSHPLTGHFRAAFQKEGELYGLVPISVLAACDVKIVNFCKLINLEAESNPSLIISLILKAATLSGSICSSKEKLWIWKQSSCIPKAMQALINGHSICTESVQIEAILIPYSLEKPVETLTLNVSCNEYYLDVIARELGVTDCSRVIISRTVGKASSEMRFYFPAEDSLLASDSSLDELSHVNGTASLESKFNVRASYFSGQSIYGTALLAAVGYTWKSMDLYHEDIFLGTYYRMLIGRTPNGNYKLTREAILSAELPTAFTSRSNWRGSFPRDLLSMFCRQHRLSEPDYRTLEMCEKLKPLKLTEDIEFGNGEGNANGGESGRQCTYGCEIRILSKAHDVIIKYSTEDSYRKQSDAIQCAALKILSWLNAYFRELNIPNENSSFANVHGIYFDAQSFSREFAFCPYVHNFHQRSVYRKCSSQGSETVTFDVEGSDSGVSPSSGCLTCISYIVSLVREGKYLGQPLESKDEFEFEIGTGAVIHQLESCVTQMSVNQTARFIMELPSKDLILAACGEAAKTLSLSSLDGCLLEYSVKVLRVAEPLEDRIEQALFSPPLSKQRVEYALRHINESHASTLVDFGCGSGSLLDSLLEHPTALQKIVGVDISRKSLSRAAKTLRSKLSMTMDPTMQSSHIESAVLYDGSITDFDSRLYGFDIGTCLEVIEHMEEDQAHLFGDIVLSSFCPQILIVSTPNYEYNPILQRITSPNRDEDPEENSHSLPFKFRNHDHKFEWTREQFNSWASTLALKHNYNVEFGGVGGRAGVEPGFASQIAVFRRNEEHQAEKYVIEGNPSHPYDVIWEWPTVGPDVPFEKESQYSLSSLAAETG